MRAVAHLPITVLLLESLLSSPFSARAEAADGETREPGHYEGYSEADVPERWKGESSFLVRYVIPEPSDPPDVEAGARPIEIRHPGTKQEILHLKVGDRIRLSAASKRDGWRLSQVEVSSGVLWPVPGARRVFHARCPGRSDMRFDRSAFPIPIDPTQSPDWVGTELAIVDVVVEAAGAAPPGCRGEGAFDPPRIPNPGVVTSAHFGWGISMKVGDSFVLSDDSGSCGAEIWNANFLISDTRILHAIRMDADGVHIQAIAPGIADLAVPDPINCARYGKGMTTLGNRFLIDVK